MQKPCDEKSCRVDFEGSEESNDETVTSSQVAIDTKYTNLSKNQMTSLCGNLILGQTF